MKYFISWIVVPGNVLILVDFLNTSDYYNCYFFYKEHWFFLALMYFSKFKSDSLVQKYYILSLISTYRSSRSEVFLVKSVLKISCFATLLKTHFGMDVLL